MIALWNNRGVLNASFRNPDGSLRIEALCTAEYVAFAKRPDVLADNRNIIDRQPDFPGWWKLTFVDYDSRKQALELNPSLLFEADVSPVRRYISDHPEVTVEPPKRGFLDIETDSRQSFASAIEGGSRLLSFAIEGEDGVRHSAVLEDDSDLFEAELWQQFWEACAEYDQLCAWNGDAFDFLVMDKRSRLLARRFPKHFKAFWEHQRRLLFIDHLACFKRHHMAAGSGDEKTSFKLGDVCEALIGEGKEHADPELEAIVGKKGMGGSTWELWAAGGYARKQLLAYNIQDTALLPKLEKETGYLDLQQSLAELSLTFANSHGLKPSPQIDGYLLRMAHNEKTHLRSKRQGGDGNHEQFAGAFVLKPTKLGLHKNVHVCDFKSLYPTVVRTFNISPEMKGVGLDMAKAFGTDVEFAADEEGMFPRLMREGMAGRDRWKKEYKKDPNNKAAERKSKAFKIFVNSCYGVMGNPYFRFYDPQLAESVTQCAKALNEATANAAKERGWDVIYMDTDSLFVVGCTVEEFKEFVAWCNKELYPRILKERGVNLALNCIELDYEKQFLTLVFPLGNCGEPAAKRYFGSFAHYAFKPKDTPEIRGLEYMRTDGTRYARRLQKQIIDLILSGQEDPTVFHEWVRRQRTLFFDGALDPNDLAASASISMDIEDYKVDAPHVRVAKELASRGEDVSEGTRIRYLVADGSVSPAKVIPVEDFTGELDRIYYWKKKIYPATMRVLQGAFPTQPWHRWSAKYPKVKVLPGQLALI